MATYNGAKYIKEQVDSILAQLGDEDELVVSDDGSTDQTLQILAEFRDPRIKIHSHAKTAQKYLFDYTTSNFGNALRYSVGDYVFFADQDDVWLPNKVCLMTEALQNHILVVSDCKITDAILNIKQESYFQINRSAAGILHNLVHNSFLGSCMAFRRELLRFALPFPKSGVAHDIWLGLLATHYGRVAFIDKPLMLYRRYSGTVSPSGGRSSNSIIFRVKYRLLIIIHFLFRVYGKAKDTPYI